MKEIYKHTLYFVFVISLFSFPTFAEDISNIESIPEIKFMKERIKQLEERLGEVKEESKEENTQHYHSVKGLGDRLGRVEKEIKEKTVLEEWPNRITLNGLLEVEAGHESMEFSDPSLTDTDTSDIALATVALGIDAYITKHVSGHATLLWEEDGTEPVDLDEGFVSINGYDVIPLYMDIGKIYVPFGSFESHFISDPLTLEIGETRESAVKVGWANDMFDISFSFFNGDIDEITSDDKIGTFAGSAVFTLPEGLVPNFSLAMGVSYISNIADSNGLEGEVVAGAVNDHVRGIGVFLSVSLMESLFLEVEYVGAIDNFKAGELSFDNGLAYKPKTFNLELAWAPREDLELGFKYEGGDDLGDVMPEKQFGAVITYALFENTSLGFEYLHGEFDNNDKRDLFTTQIAIEF